MMNASIIRTFLNAAGVRDPRVLQAIDRLMSGEFSNFHYGTVPPEAVAAVAHSDVLELSAHRSNGDRLLIYVITEKLPQNLLTLGSEVLDTNLGGESGSDGEHTANLS